MGNNCQPKPGRFIVLEGPNYAGKTTLLKALEQYLQALGITVIITREPGGTALGEYIRPALKDPRIHATPFAQLLGFNTARAQLNEEVIDPNIAQGNWVLSDRYWFSTEIYQTPKLTPNRAELARKLHLSFRQPDLTFFILPPAEVLFNRAQAGRLLELDRYESNELKLIQNELERYTALAQEIKPAVIFHSNEQTQTFVSDPAFQALLA